MLCQFATAASRAARLLDDPRATERGPGSVGRMPLPCIGLSL